MSANRTVVPTIDAAGNISAPPFDEIVTYFEAVAAAEPYISQDLIFEVSRTQAAINDAIIRKYNELMSTAAPPPHEGVDFMKEIRKVGGV